MNAFSLVPRATLEIQGGVRRLDRIITLIESCRYSIHDLSRVELDPTPPPTPRFNMPFELGLAVEFARFDPGKHTWFLFETEKFRIQKSLSDLNGTDPYVHEGSIKGVFRELTQTFVRVQRQPTVKIMRQIYQGLIKVLPKYLSDAGARDPFQARVFQDLSVIARTFANEKMN